jgi:hypothetical protein
MYAVLKVESIKRENKGVTGIKVHKKDCISSDRIGYPGLFLTKTDSER